MLKVVIGTKVCSFEELVEEYGRVCKENEKLRNQISELESKLETSKHLFDIKHSLKEFSGKSPTEYKKELCKSYTLEEMAGVVVDLEKQLNEMQEIANEYGDKCSELESELSVKENLLKIKNACTDKDWGKDLKAMVDFEIHIDEKTLKKFAELGKEGKILEDPLPFSGEQYEEEPKAELPTMPIDVASMLINAKIEYPTISLLKVLGAGETSFADKYSRGDLREIAEHLLVYCNNSDEDEDDTQS